MEGFCKACLVRYEDPSELLQYTEKNRRLYMYSTGLQVKQNDIIPFHICQACFMRMKEACQFKKQCRTSDKRLNHFLSLKAAGEETDFSTYLQNNEGSTLFKFPINGTSTPSYQKPKDDDNVSTSTSIRNFMADFLREDEVPDTEAHIIREMIEQEADVLDDSLDSHWLQEDISIASDFRFSPFSTPLSKHNYQPLLNYSPVKTEPQQPEEQNYGRRNILAAKKLLLNPKSCSSSQTDSPISRREHANQDIEFRQKRNILSAKLLLSAKSCSSSQTESPRSQENENDEETDLAVKNILGSETASYMSKTESVNVNESIDHDHKSYIARKRMLLKPSSKQKHESKQQKGKNMETILATKSIQLNSKSNSIDSENEDTTDVTHNIPLVEKEIYEPIGESNINQDILLTHKGFYIENVDANENTLRINDVEGKADNIDKNLEKILNNTDDEVISLSALLASPSSEVVQANNNIIATPSVHQGLSGANTPTIANILFGEKLDDEQSIQPDLKPCKEEITEDNSDIDILEDFFNKNTGQYVGEFVKEQDEFFEEYKNPKLEVFMPGKSQYDLSDFSCKRCNVRYNSQKGLKIHFAKAHNMKIICERDKESRVDMPCEYCGKVFGLKSCLSKHVKTMHIAPKRPQKCKVCNLEFASEGRLKLHMKIHEGVIPTPKQRDIDNVPKGQEMVCPICGHVCTKSYNLKVHLARHNKTYTCRCDFCDRGFYRKTDLEIHMRLHMDLKPFQCQQCSASFRRKDQLQIHLKRHGGERPYACDICCKMFATSSKLRNHQNNSITCKGIKIETALKENKAIEENTDPLFVTESHVMIGYEEILSGMKVETIEDDKGEQKDESPNLEDILMGDLTSHTAKHLEEDTDDKMSISDIFTIPVIIQ